MHRQAIIENSHKLNKDDLIVIAGAGGLSPAPGPLLPRPGLHPHPRRRQEAAARVVPARARASSACAWI